MLKGAEALQGFGVGVISVIRERIGVCQRESTGRRHRELTLLHLCGHLPSRELDHSTRLHYNTGLDISIFVLSHCAEPLFCLQTRVSS